jgi:hypothetical protein
MRLTVLTHRRVLQILPPAEGRWEESAHKDRFQRHPGPGMLTVDFSNAVSASFAPAPHRDFTRFSSPLVALNGPLGTC